MDFGRVNESELQNIKWALPEEPVSHRQVLESSETGKTKFHVGLSRWGRKEWIGRLYPKGTKENQFLSEYAKHFNSIELNATHYTLIKTEQIQGWADKVAGKEFLFCPKFYNAITHTVGLDDKKFLTDTFIQSLSDFGSRLGPAFIQMSDKFSPKRKEELFRFLSALPKEMEFFLELRHPDWFEEPNKTEIFNQLRRMRIGAVITDTAGRRDVAHMHLTVPKTFIRFIGNNLHPTDFNRLDEWVDRIKHWSDNGLEEVYFFVHSVDDTYSPELASYLIKQLNQHCNAGLKEIVFLNNQA